MYRAILRSGSIECTDYDRVDHGVDLHENGQFVAFVPYENLIALVDETTTTAEDRSIL
jgi:hypothetical protein